MTKTKKPIFTAKQLKQIAKNELNHRIGLRLQQMLDDIEHMTEIERRSHAVAGSLMLSLVKDYCDARGAKTEIARIMSKISGRKVTRDMVRGWLHSDPTKRRDPSFPY